jgi:uncharacterized membrane protein
MSDIVIGPNPLLRIGQKRIVIGALVDGRLFLAYFGISLEEGLQLGFAHVFLHDM